MFSYTHNNHFRFGYDGEWFNLPDDHHQEMCVDYGQCQRRPASFPEECRVAAKHISGNPHRLLPNLCFSGGIDSEIMVRIFLEENLPFKITILKFENDLNLHDISFAIAYCEARGLDYELLYLDVEAFFRSHRFLEIADKTKCVSPQICAHIWMISQMDEFPVFGCGEGCVVKTVPDDYVPGESEYLPSEWHLYESEKQMAMYRYCIETGRIAVPGFFRYTPQQLYTFLDNPVVKELVADKRIGKLSSQTSKCEIYQHWFPDIQTRPKFHGFERIPQIEQRRREFLIARLPQYTRRVHTEYHQLMKHLWPGRVT